MATFNGFESFDVWSDGEYVFFTQVSNEFGKHVTIQIPCHLWNEIETTVQNDMHQASLEVDA